LSPPSPQCSCTFCPRAPASPASTPHTQKLKLGPPTPMTMTPGAHHLPQCA
jgi:hypothetical protein